LTSRRRALVPGPSSQGLLRSGLLARAVPSHQHECHEPAARKQQRQTDRGLSRRTPDSGESDVPDGEPTSCAQDPERPQKPGGAAESEHVSRVAHPFQRSDRDVACVRNEAEPSEECGCTLRTPSPQHASAQNNSGPTTPAIGPAHTTISGRGLGFTSVRENVCVSNTTPVTVPPVTSAASTCPDSCRICIQSHEAATSSTACTTPGGVILWQLWDVAGACSLTSAKHPS